MNLLISCEYPNWAFDHQCTFNGALVCHAQTWATSAAHRFPRRLRPRAKRSQVITSTCIVHCRLSKDIWSSTMTCMKAGYLLWKFRDVCWSSPHDDRGACLSPATAICQSQARNPLDSRAELQFRYYYHLVLQ